MCCLSDVYEVNYPPVTAARNVTNGSNHWILRQPDQVSKNWNHGQGDAKSYLREPDLPQQGGHEVLFAATRLWQIWFPQIGPRVPLAMV